MNKNDQHERLNLMDRYVGLLRQCVDSDDLYTIENALTIMEVLLDGFNKELQKDLLTEKDLENTTYKFTLEDGTVVEAKGNDEIEYDGEMHSAANLYDALKEGYYGKF